MRSEAFLSADRGDIMGRHRIVAGFDGSPGSEAAVEWAAAEATARCCALRVVTCSAVPEEIDFYRVGARQVEMMAAMVDGVRERHPALTVDSARTHLDPRDVLLDEGAESDLLVLGASVSRSSKAFLLGSVARLAVRRSPCPVVIMRGEWAHPVRRIVVGFDGSAAAGSAIEWACGEASLHRAEIVAVWATSNALADADHTDARIRCDAAISRCRERTGHTVTVSVVGGSAADALVEASADADLVVVGSRGRGAVSATLLGSVAMSVADRARCPVVITHSPTIRTSRDEVKDR